MNYKAIALLTGGVMIGALTFGAIGASAQTPDISFSNGQGPGYGMNRDEKPMGPNRGLVAEVLGMDFDELRAQIQDGKTMEEIAVAQGYDNFESFKNEVENRVRARMEEDGLSEDEINERIERHEQRMEERMANPDSNFERGNGLRDGSGMGRHGMRNLDN